MAANSYFYGLTVNKELVGGNTALITSEQQKESLFEWFQKHECIVGFIATHWECGFVDKTNKTWFGDQAYELELYRKLEERYPGIVDKENTVMQESVQDDKKHMHRTRMF